MYISEIYLEESRKGKREAIFKLAKKIKNKNPELKNENKLNVLKYLNKIGWYIGGGIIYVYIRNIFRRSC